MIYKRLLVLLVFLSSLVNASNSFLMPDQAFKTSLNTTKDTIVFNLELADSIYIYDEQLVINIIQNDKTTDITKQLNIPKSQEYHDTQVHFGILNIKVPSILIQQITNNNDATVEFNFQGCSKAGLCYQPMTKSIEFKGEKVAVLKPVKEIKSESGLIVDTFSNGSIFLVLLTFFGFGLLLALTPCVFPMIPILSSIIVSHSTKTGKEMDAMQGLKLSFVYVLAMSVAYTVAGIIAGLFGANLQAALQNPYVLVSFAAMFVALAFSMFGYYEISIPTTWQTKLDKLSHGQDENKGYMSVAVMGFLSALIVGPCVAPPLAGALVYIGQTGDALLGGAALFVMSMGMGAPLLLVGAGAGKYMPKPGGWMDTVSKVFGVVMLGVAIWMLERIIPIGFTFMLWSLLFFGAGIYLLRAVHMIIFKIFATLLILIGIIFGIGIATKATNILNPLENVIGEKVVHLEFKRVKSVKGLDEIIANSTQPIMLDFYADWCISCKEMEHDTFSNKKVQDKLKGFILLQVDTTANSDEDKALLKKFNLFGPPGIIFWKDKKELKNITTIGYKSPEEFLEIMGQEF